MNVQTYSSKDLTLTIEDEEARITIVWTGKSTAKEPTVFLAPILKEVLSKARTDSKRILLDFRHLEYMNSSTITPIIRVLDEARRGTSSVSIIYDDGLKWQDLSFSALRVFQTSDRRISISGGSV